MSVDIMAKLFKYSGKLSVPKSKALPWKRITSLGEDNHTWPSLSYEDAFVCKLLTAAGTGSYRSYRSRAIVSFEDVT